MKVCNKCGEAKPLSDFYKEKSKKDGYRNDCKACVRARSKAHYEANREKVAARQKAYNEANREEIAAYLKAYREANREEVAAQRKAYREANSEMVSAAQKAYYEANRERIRASVNASRTERYATDPEYRAKRDAANTRRQRLLEGAKSEPYLREDIFERDDWTCQLCQEPIDPELKWPDSGFASIDHIVPLSLGGDDTPANVQAAHLSCNISKHNRVELEDLQAA